jgi:hypothetical protein
MAGEVIGVLRGDAVATWRMWSLDEHH